jgi:hypothetical protein
MPKGSITVGSVDETFGDGVVCLTGADGGFALITVEEYARWKAVIAKATGIPVTQVSLVGRTLGPEA